MELKQGQVVKVISGFYDVLLNNNEIIRLRASGNLRNKNITPLVGDFVDFNDSGLLLNIHQRKNSLIRPKVANVDQAAIVISLNEPKFSSLLLDRFLIMVEFQKIRPIIVFTKADIGNKKHMLDYQSQGYKCFLLDNKNQNDENDLEQLKKELRNNLNVFMGQSGVGKSTTINRLLNTKILTNEISKALGRGKHTTRVVEIHSYNNIKIIDTPGFGTIAINLSPQQIANAYNDFNQYSKKCKFRSCIHFNENIEECYVKQQVKNKKILQSRYDNYLKILQEAIDNYSMYE